VAWHAAYDDPTSSLSRRLAVVQQRIRLALDAAPPGPIRVLSLCAGDARDATGALRGHPRVHDVSGVLVEFDEHLARAARANVAAAGVSLVVRRGDAADTRVFTDVVPVDVLLLVGIFGNITDEDVAATVATVPALCRSGASVIWTRHRRAPDLTPRIRDWFDLAGCESVDLSSPEGESFAVGTERVATSSPLPVVPHRLFTFRDDLW
jgi:hypothetical protein